MTATDIDQRSIDTIRTLVDGRGPEGEQRPPGPADGHGAGGLPAVHADHGAQPADPEWPDRDRFVLSAGHGSMLLYSALHLVRLRPVARRAQALPPVGIAHPGPPGARPRPRDAGRRGHDRPARAGLRQRRRHGDRRALPARALRRRGHGPPHLRDRLRRRPHGGHRLRGRVAGRPPGPRPARLPLRRQRDLARRPDVAELQTEDVGKRFEAYGWQVLEVDDANDLDALERAIDAGAGEDERRR